jgi:hypothetical protein
VWVRQWSSRCFIVDLFKLYGLVSVEAIPKYQTKVGRQNDVFCGSVANSRRTLIWASSCDRMRWFEGSVMHIPFWVHNPMSLLLKIAR